MASEVTTWGGNTGNALKEMLSAGDIQPGDSLSYQLAKTILAYHPLGLKMTESPIKAAQCQQRRLVCGVGKAEEEIIRAFRQEWKDLKADGVIKNVGKQARAYGVAALGVLVAGTDPAKPLDVKKLYGRKIAFNVWDPLNVSGSMVFNQDPNALDFQKPTQLVVQGQAYHPSRTVGLLNEDPLFIEYTTSGYGYVGRSVYQRALYPMKTYLLSLITDNQVLLKGAVLVTKLKGWGSPVDQFMAGIAGLKRAMIKEAVVENVITVGADDTIETLNFQNLEGPVTMARKNVLENIATASDMPAMILNQETFAEGFADGTEDSKRVADWVASIREWLRPVYEFMDHIVMHRAWNEEWYATIQKRWPEDWAGVDYKTAFYKMKNAFQHEWPNLLQEPDSEKVKVDDVRLKAVIAVLELLLAMPDLGQENRAQLIEWLMATFDSLEIMFEAPLELDSQAVADYEPPAPVAGDGANDGEENEAGGGVKAPQPAKPFSAQDSVMRRRDAVRGYDDALGKLYEMLGKREERRLRAAA